MRRKRKRVKSFKFLSKFLISIIVVLLGLILLKSNPSLKSAIYRYVFENNLKFAKINEIYEKYFGSALPLTGGKSNIATVSSQKIEFNKEEGYKDGVRLEVANNYAIPILNSGIVVFTGDKEGYGKTVIIQGADEVEIWYSNLKDIKVSMYDYLKKGSIIGEVDNGTLILVFTRNGNKLDYKKYI